jgi:hypothetical protein
MTDNHGVANLLLRGVSEHDGAIEMHQEAIAGLEPESLLAELQLQRALKPPEMLVAASILESSRRGGGDWGLSGNASARKWP